MIGHAGWYPDPAQEVKKRYWDGESWDGRPADGGTWPPPEVPDPRVASTTADGQPLAGWWRRGLAAVVDSVVVLLVWSQVARLWGIDPLASIADNADGTRDRAEVTLSATGAVSFAVAAALLQLCYVVGFLLWRQATPGKLLLGLRVRPRDAPGPLTLRAVLLRWLVQLGPTRLAFQPGLAVVVWVLFVLDHGWPLQDRRRQALHDKVASTVVVARSAP